MTENDYQLAWAAYGVAALGCLLVWCKMTGWMWRWLREPLRLLMAVLLLTPSVVDSARDLYAPAVAMTALDLLFQSSNPLRIVAEMAAYGTIVFAIYLLFVFLRWPIENWFKSRQSSAIKVVNAADEPTLREVMARNEADNGNTRFASNGDRHFRIDPRI